MDPPASSPSAPRSINGQQQRSNPIHPPMARPAHSIPGTGPGERLGKKGRMGRPPYAGAARDGEGSRLGFRLAGSAPLSSQPPAAAFLGGQGERNGGPPPIRSRCAEEDSGFFF
ncbi:hypothetical protein PAHAL_2G278500 [Panicum hallii]|uniref:Uncharacterized protein n=1 Tax=Panicum hallii TaxID=206008 RepID=A0A2S3H088_9POAL|nr:hypothetical protein PAHAL_2G278500 [Panicum hallii]